jgi:ribosomal protein S18 acetylase RimI-like enzyme
VSALGRGGGGGSLVLRDATAGDVDAARVLLHELSPGDRYFRFHSPITHVTTATAKALVTSGPDAHTVVAVDGTRLAGAATCTTRRDGTPELAVVVHEAHRRRGVGLRLVLLATAARAGSVAVATVLVENTAALGLVRKLDPHARGIAAFGCVDVTLTIPSAGSPQLHAWSLGPGRAGTRARGVACD